MWKKNKIEACIAEATILQEIENATIAYYADEVPSMHNQVPRYNVDEPKRDPKLLFFKFPGGKAWDSMRMKKPDLSQPQPQLPEYFGTAQEDGAKYLEAMVGFNPELEDPRTAEPDERALVVSGGGLQHGRLKVMNKMIPRTPTLSLTRIKATLGADDPAPPPRRPPSTPGYDVSFSHFHPFSHNTTSSVA